MKSFAEILGQDEALRTLRAGLRDQRLASGYLFFGPDGVGKRTTALAFGRAILCRSRTPGEDACGTCPACNRLRGEGHRGFITVVVETGSEIKLEQIQELGRLLALTPVEGREQVAIFPEAERIGTLQANGLLKILEEPPAGASIILVTERPDALPDTIRSRCQAVRFRPLSAESILRILPDDEDGRRLAPLAAGSLGRIERLRAIDILTVLDEVDKVARESPLLAADICIQAVKGGPSGKLKDVRKRAIDLLSVFLERERQILSGGGDPERADICYRRLVKGLDNLSRNVDPDTVLRATLVEIGPEWKNL
jgi:DNA polymerase III, delta subunit